MGVPLPTRRFTVDEYYRMAEAGILVLRPRSDDYADAHPGPGDVLLLIEVALTSAGIDRGVKAPLYARNGRGRWGMGRHRVVRR